ncbi:hypothetical protein RhiirA1_463572 [Rhizophagus irregularis]|uniref:Galactose oxidase n=1 Tax=Rhizophagus irregularis TaxID=588596 RepID=A0A2N0RJS2_9GLOM|nr:hypothetical protein RhiirA1_463572 [Rhizophagus irregularis]
MPRNSSVYFILWILVLQVEMIIIIGKRLKEFFYLDVSVPFNTQELTWQDLSNINMIPAHSSAASVKGGANNDTLFLYGGATSDTMALVYTFDSQSIVWSIPKITGINTVRKRDLTGIINNDGRMYLWSGNTGTVYANEMLIIDTINLSCSEGSLVNAPIPRVNYGAALFPNNRIIYIGGVKENPTLFDETLNIIQGSALALSEVYIYDTVNDSWDTKITSGKIPSNRGGFSAILGLDGQRIIIYGGFFSNPGYLDTTLYVLDLNNYNWYVPKISGKIPKPRTYHKANVIGKYIWLYHLDMVMIKHNTTGAILGTLLGGILLSVGSFLIYKWNKNKREQSTIHGNENYNDYGQEEKELPIIRDIHNYGQVINNNNEQEIIQIPRKENTTNHEPTIIPANNHGQEIKQTSENENNVINLSLQAFKDEMLQVVKQEINQNLRNEILKVVRRENYHNTKNNTRQD